MSWTYEITQLRNQQGDLIPLFTVVQWNTSTPNEKFETTITEAVKNTCYPED